MNLTDEQKQKHLQQALMYGAAITKTGIRKWWNPLRYIKGRIYTKAVTLEEVFK